MKISNGKEIMITSAGWTIKSKGGFEAVLLTDRVRRYVQASRCREGCVNLFYRHTTGSIIITEYEIGIMADLKDLLDSICDKNRPFKHHLRGVDRNGHSHMWSVMLSPSAAVTVPFSGGELLLGEYQEIVMIDMQDGANPREIIAQLVGF